MATDKRPRSKPKQGKSQTASLAGLDDVRQKADLAHRAFVKRVEFPDTWTIRRRDFITAYQALWRQLPNPSVQMPQNLQAAANAYGKMHGPENFASDGEAELEATLHSVDRYVGNGEAMSATPTIGQLNRDLRSAALTYRRSRTSANRDAFLALYAQAARMKVPFLNDFADLRAAASQGPYRTAAPDDGTSQPSRKQRPQSRESEWMSEGEWELEQLLDRFV